MVQLYIFIYHPIYIFFYNNLNILYFIFYNNLNILYFIFYNNLNIIIYIFCYVSFLQDFNLHIIKNIPMCMYMLIFIYI
jgi:hypothetical protein